MTELVKTHKRRRKGGKRKTVEVKEYERKKKGNLPYEKEPDIAFWFDEKDDTTYLVRVNDSLEHVQLLQACFDLLAKAMRSDEGTKIAEWRT